MAGVWIISESRERALELLNIGRHLAGNLRTQVSALLYREHEEAQDYIRHGADEVVLLPPLKNDQSLDIYIPAIVDEARKGKPDLILLPATANGKELAARIAGRLDVGLCSSSISLNLDDSSGSLVMERLAYGGMAVQKVTCTTRPAMATIPPRTFDTAIPEEGRQGQIRQLPAPPPSTVKILERKAKERAEKDISESRAVVCVGRGFDKKEDLAIARKLADVLGGEIGCTRPIAEEFHWLPEEVCIGLSGVQVKPDIYIGLGVSGQVQHVTGIRNAKVIAAVNKDESAPIFRVADFGVIGDLYDVVPKLTDELTK